MFARSTTVRGRPEAIDDGIRQVRDQVLPALQEMDGFVGLSMLADRETGRCIITTSWQDEAAISASREAVKGLRSRAVELLGGPEPEIREWEIATLHREHPADLGACARVTWVKVRPELVDRQIEVFRGTILPQLQDLPGFCSASLLVDRSSGRATGAIAYASRQALEASREATTRIRSEVIRTMEAELLDVGEFEVAIAHLRVPEMA
ncbi:MAG: uncharacterized protein JWN08_2121 [Frankiales bacterium]|nr:uncharacterized protein [Frankiales bacterium]